MTNNFEISINAMLEIQNSEKLKILRNTMLEIQETINAAFNTPEFRKLYLTIERFTVYLKKLGEDLSEIFENLRQILQLQNSISIGYAETPSEVALNPCIIFVEWSRGPPLNLKKIFCFLEKYAFELIYSVLLPYLVNCVFPKHGLLISLIVFNIFFLRSYFQKE